MGRRERKIIVFKEETPDQEKVDLVNRFQAKVLKKLAIVNGLALTLPPEAVSQLAQDPRVVRIDPDVEISAAVWPRKKRISSQGWCDRFPWLPWCRPTPTPKPTATPTPTPTDPSPTPTSTPVPPSPTPTPVPDHQPVPWNIAQVKAPEAWSSSTGNEVKVAVIDSGIDINHPDLANNIAGCLNLIRPWRSCQDDNGHGTHVSGIIAAEDNPIGVVGAAPQAKIYALKVLDRRGRGYLSDLLEALDWVMKNNIEVVNMSLSTRSDIASLREAVEEVSNAGIIQVAAAGNYGPDEESLTYPAKYPQVIAVAATDKNNHVSSFSSRGAELDLAAPGEEVFSTYPRNSYRIMSGTSMAAPHVSGAVALRLFLYPEETPGEIEAILENTADPLPYPATAAGAGLLNVYNFIAAP